MTKGDNSQNGLKTRGAMNKLPYLQVPNVKSTQKLKFKGRRKDIGAISNCANGLLRTGVPCVAPWLVFGFLTQTWTARWTVFRCFTVTAGAVLFRFPPPMQFFYVNTQMSFFSSRCLGGPPSSEILAPLSDRATNGIDRGYAEYLPSVDDPATSPRCWLLVPAKQI